MAFPQSNLGRISCNNNKALKTRPVWAVFNSAERENLRCVLNLIADVGNADMTVLV